MHVAARAVAGAAFAAVLGTSLWLAPAAAAPSPVPVSPADIATTTTPAASGSDVLALLSQANSTLRALGIQPFLNPSVAFNCVAPTATNPLGLAPAVGGAVPGPFTAPGIALPNIPFVAIDPNVVSDGQTLYGFVPAGISPAAAGAPTQGMQVAWFNVATGRGGLAATGTPGQTLVDRYLARVPNGPAKTAAATTLTALVDRIVPPGSRLAPVDTGKGTVLSAVFGTVQNGARSCFFLPMVGITNA